MIRFVDLRGQECGGRFAWYDTVRGEFENWWGRETWETFEDFERDFTLGTDVVRLASSSWAARFQRYKSLAADWSLSPRRNDVNEPLVTERRAMFVYNAARLAAISAEAPVVPVPWDEREDAFREQFLRVIERQCGDQRSRSPEELHGSWMQAYFAMGWTYGEVHDPEKKLHPDLVPYAELGQLERDKDAVFVALCEIARQWIYEPEKEK